MKLTVDEDADALYLRLVDVPVIASREVAPGIIVDYDADDHPIGIETLRLSSKSRPVNLREIQLTMHRTPLNPQTPSDSAP